MKKGIFGDLFDFDGDGTANSAEQAAELLYLDRVTGDAEKTDFFQDALEDTFEDAFRDTFEDGGDDW